MVPRLQTSFSTSAFGHHNAHYHNHLRGDGLDHGPDPCRNPYDDHSRGHFHYGGHNHVHHVS